MDLSSEWKSLFPIGRDPTAPLLASRSNRTSESAFGPLLFKPEPHSEPHLLFSSLSLSPPLLSPFSYLSLPRFLSTSSSILPSTASFISAQFGVDESCEDAASTLTHNRLQILLCLGADLMLLFFPTGSNLDQIGFLMLSVEKSGLRAKGSEDGEVLVAKERFHSRIVRILVNPADDFAVRDESLATFGYVMAYTMCSVHWYSVIFSESSERPVLNYLGFKPFKSSAIVSACWSPHLPEECLVLLENGALFLLVLEGKLNGCFRQKRLKVSWDNQCSHRKFSWLGCEFSWHPRIFIVASSDSVFLADFRSEECVLTCLAKIETFSMYASLRKEWFLAFSKAGTDGFHFVLASQSLLLLCDVRRPLTPLLQWTHAVENPCFIDFYRLSELRSTSGSGIYDWATESGSCIILGSFWNSQFSLFCFGPSASVYGQSVPSEVSRCLQAWELPSDLLLAGQECRCGDCILKEDILKESLPDWIDWRQKKAVVLGFCVLNRYASITPLSSSEPCGFTLIRLLSSGKLEAERYCASWKLAEGVESAHEKLLQKFDSNLYYSADDEYKFPKRFKYLSLNYLQEYLDGNLAEYMDSKTKIPPKDVERERFSSLELHETLCEKLKICGFGKDRASPALSVVFSDVILPTSIFEIALRQAWADLPMELLLLAFSSCAEFLDVLLDKKKMSLEFLIVPDQPQIPPFLFRNPSLRSSKWTNKVQPTDNVAGPVLPLPILLTLHEFRDGCSNPEEDSFGFSADAELSNWCNQIYNAAHDMAIMGRDSGFRDDKTVSLADDREDIWADSQRPKPFISYCPASIESPSVGCTTGDTFYKDKDLTTFIAKVSERNLTLNCVGNAEVKRFSNLCPIDLKLDDPSINFGSSVPSLYDALEKQFSLWQQSFSAFQEFLARHNI